jgi:hypothetical protein
MNVTNFHSEKKIPATLVSKISMPPGPSKTEPAESDVNKAIPVKMHCPRAGILE